MQILEKKGRFLSCTLQRVEHQSNNFPCQFCQLNTGNHVAMVA